MSLTFQWKGNEFKCDSLPHSYPLLKPLYLEYEHTWNGHVMSEWCNNHWEVAIYSCLAYLTFVFGGGWVMKTFDLKYNLKPLLAVWNLMLATFSFIGAIRVVPQLLFILNKYGFERTVCAHPETTVGAGASGLWTTLFVLSKIPELGDTVFIVLRRRPVIFLHWYHHVSVLLYCWHSYATHAANGGYFIGMNYSVHAVMYFYYFLMAINRKPTWINPIFITIFQLSQMVVGIFVCVAVYYYKNILNHPCAVTDENMLAGGVMYFSYFLLFLNFLLQRFVFKQPVQVKKPKKA